MKLISKDQISFESDTGVTVILPCMSETDIGETLSALTKGAFESARRLAEDFKPGKDESCSLFFKNVRIDLVGVKSASYGVVRQALHTYAVKCKIGDSQPLLYMEHLQSSSEFDMLLEAAVNGIGLAAYKAGLYKSGNGNGQVTELALYGRAIPDAASRGAVTASTQCEILGLVNAPSNHKSPQTLADWAVRSGATYGYHVKVLEEQALEEQGFHGLLAVNRGSEYPARFIICDYSPGKPDVPTVALVGKGVTFDTGGISIKPSNNMHFMKSDMGGAAAVLGAVELCARMQVNARVVGFVPSTDNSVDARAIKPGDVIQSYSGQTIEVINTDAEGRLILADALAYAINHYQPDHLIDLATLTGSVVRALGTQCAGLFTHNEDLAGALVNAGERIGERLWRLPLWDEYAEEMRSDIADIKNLSDKPMAGAITAAKFLEHFVDNHTSWAHLDIAGTAYKANGVSRNHTATAYGVRLLFEFVDTLSSP